VKCVNIPLTCS
jgi:activator of HSP90 ATPase